MTSEEMRQLTTGGTGLLYFFLEISPVLQGARGKTWIIAGTGPLI